ncbi:MAG TPA: carbamoyl-phosphate synthase large subunit [Tepidisphaeraceae bacterium]|jgi:carbamoyl-phosphate synthase large subunit|nr:carbamoyl-phosphate synthase large subunit [Tepidisphaeraceae bacterium]
MPKRTDIKTILIIGAGPIVIGQGVEFDYSGVQACRALKEEGYRIVLINSNPATIMTDPEFADATYIEPILPETIEKILVREKANGTPIDAVLPTLGGQTGLNTAMACFDQGIFKKYGVQMIGADREAIHRGEDRQVFKELMLSIGLNVPRSGVVHNMDDARKVLAELGLPLIIRPAFTLGGTGGGIAYNIEEFETIVQRGIDASPVNEVLIEQSVIGWKEYEMEVVRDRKDNAIIICSIENIDAMGVHTGDSITVAPIQTLTDKEYQRMRDASIAVIRAVGVETGGSNIQFGINPENGDMVVIEMNPRVSRSSALASKATGYPIAKIAAKLAVGYTLDELPNPITTKKRPGQTNDKTVPSSTKREDYELYTSACFEPTIDYCVIKIPRWTFEKFPDADETLTTQMKSVGEAMAIGRTFKEALQKGIRSMEVKRFGFGLDKYDKWLNAQNRGMGVSPMHVDKRANSFPASGAAGAPDQNKTSSPADTHGRDAHATVKSLPPSARYDDPNADKTTQGESADDIWPIPQDKLRRKLAVPSQGRLYYVRYAMKMGWTIDQIFELTNIDRWFLSQMKELVDFEAELATNAKAAFADSLANNWRTNGVVDTFVRRAKQLGYSDIQLAQMWDTTPAKVRAFRNAADIRPVYKLVDTCAAEFEAATPYYYSTYETPVAQITVGLPAGTTGKPAAKWEAIAEDEIRLTDRPKVIIIGGGPNRIGQGIEFDYCCVQAAFAMREIGVESVMINSNPETVSTDYDTSDLLFFEPLTHEDILNICERLNGGPFVGAGLRARPDSDGGPTQEGGHGGPPLHKNLVQGVIVQFGGQTPLNLARGLAEAGVPIIGTSIDSLDAAGDREQFRDLLQKLGLKQPANGIARNVDEARQIAKRIGYPVLVRPSFVLGGRAMEIVSDEDQLNYYMANAVDASTIKDAPILVDKFLDNATEVDVDCIADYEPNETGVGAGLRARPSSTVQKTEEGGHGGPPLQGQAIVIGVMEHIEEAGIHSGDSACALPPYSLSKEIIAELKRQTKELARALRVKGLMNVQYAIKDNEIYVIEVNPRASRTVPFVSKATGISWAKIAAKVMAGKTLKELNATEQPDPKHVSVKEVVFPFAKFPGVDVILGPEMRSTGEVMGIDATFELAFAKSQIAAGTNLPMKGTVFISVNDADKPQAVELARQLSTAGFDIISSSGTYAALAKADIPAKRIPKLAEGRPNIKDFIKNGQVAMIINTPTRKGPQTDEGAIRSMAVLNKVPIVTTMTGAAAIVKGIIQLQKTGWDVKPLQEYVGK